MNTTVPYTIPDQTRIGHVHLKVTDLDRALSFYRNLLGFSLVTMYGTDAAFISACGYHWSASPTSHRIEHLA
ncbi:glyoxalase/bleomycin resistance protein/dioxygenase superfamily protein [Spirosoma oryzae]|uniref:Glyoxalase/bleomycin resistance protein/dioxygenase superfamily protein n=1 Tax=Spirosoma oryzae TaxID=1469603 RepID=A0A2T0ST23_9BACT|nr:glyoxalase/bleomycin resistance protein/dioxygenase superfamily protein [Spirosoma oryzae]